MEHTCSECFRRGEIILRSATKIKNHFDGSLGKRDLEGSEGQVKRKHILPEKCLKIQSKNNLGSHDKFTNTPFWK